MPSDVQSALGSHAQSARLARLAESIPVGEGDRPRLPVRTPFTEAEIGSVPACAPADVEAAFERAREAQADWAARPLAERAQVLLDIHDLVLDRQDELLDVLQLESGKARIDGFEEVIDVALTAQYYARNAADHLDVRRRAGGLPLLTHVVERHRPVGVVGLIAPWNYPLTLAVSDALPALVAGNAVVLKPAEETPFTALLAAELLSEAGLPADLFQVVPGHGAELGPPLVDCADFVGFTGSTETGRVVARQAGEQLTPVSLELGGKNPMLVLDDADLDRAVEGAVRGCFTSAGQLCISFERLYVESRIYGRFVEAFVERTEAFDLGTAFDYGVDVGSLVSADQLAKVESHVADARERGATVLTGGRARPDVGPLFYEPTVLADVTPAMDLACEETFGPVVAVHRVESAEEAVARANDSEYGLNASVWTSDTARGRELAGRIDCGTVNVNEAYGASWAAVDAPMGGTKQSGLGRRHGRQGITKYTEAQTVATQRLLPMGVPRWLPTRCYPGAMTDVMRLLKRLGRLRP